MEEWKDWLTQHDWQVWLGLAMALGLAEVITMDLVLLMLAAGALVGMIAAVVGLPVLAQGALAAAAATAALLVVRPNLVKRLHGGPELRLGAAKLVGMQGTVTSEVSATGSGRIKVDGEDWSAKPYDETITIAAGEIVDVFQIDGATAIVHPVPRLDS